jgi:general secretion pathway protein D
VGIRISLEVSNLVDTITTKSGTTAYRIGTRSASTMLQLKDGENQVLAGLIQNEDRSSGTKLPVLGDVPLLGRLFGSNQDTRNKTEVVLSITPHLVRNIQRPPAFSSEFSSGTEANFRRRPDMATRAPVQLSVPQPLDTSGAQPQPALAPRVNPTAALSQVPAQPQLQPPAVLPKQSDGTSPAAPGAEVNSGWAGSVAPQGTPSSPMPANSAVQAITLPPLSIRPLPATPPAPPSISPSNWP